MSKERRSAQKKLWKVLAIPLRVCYNTLHGLSERPKRPKNANAVCACLLMQPAPLTGTKKSRPERVLRPGRLLRSVLRSLLNGVHDALGKLCGGGRNRGLDRLFPVTKNTPPRTKHHPRSGFEARCHANIVKALSRFHQRKFCISILFLRNPKNRLRHCPIEFDNSPKRLRFGDVEKQCCDAGTGSRRLRRFCPDFFEFRQKGSRFRFRIAAIGPCAKTTRPASHSPDDLRVSVGKGR